MKTNKRIFAVVVLLACTAAAQDAPVGLRKMLDAQTSAWNRGDLDGFMQGYWHSPKVTFFSADTITQGWEPTLARYRSRYQGSGKAMGKLSFTDEEIDMLAPGAAVVTARWHLEMPDGKKLEGLTTVLCKRLKEGWRIVHDHSS